ncbi:DUF305 domain-containing protein [Aquabacterium sp.]|uniref:DUF305 domain-containing protein n=1 Tax=Aquabacterium sp. TaxID=1872578 RepID=UPI002488BC94|nr:DUF305 domain-containing protein [Aquabacterium sp.]MDI1257747.1 DUF305 domain-containing protein [Aquabacterium sp.]
MASTRSPVEGAWRNACVLMVLFAAGAAPLVGHHWLGLPAANAPTETAPAHLAHGPVDIGFAQDMSVHHEQALTMARMALAQGSPQVRLLAQGIINQQLKEIGYLQGWLMLWNAPSVADSGEMTWMRTAYAQARQRVPAYDQFIESCAQGQGMPGLATPVELEALEALSLPDQFDRTFLALMIRHHQGAIVMAQFTSEHAASDMVRGFAKAIAAEQLQEMSQMLTLLRAG